MMSQSIIKLAIAISAVIFGTFAYAEGVIKPSDDGQSEKVIDEKLKEQFPPSFPTAGTILKAAREGKGRAKNEHIQCKLVQYDVSDARNYPNVGAARVARSRFECTVMSDAGQKVVYICQCRLIAVK